MGNKKSTIIYTKTDEAPALATYSFLPIIKGFLSAAGIEIELADISLVNRILAAFPDFLTEEQRVGDVLTELGELVLKADTNIIKLPNISASIPQLKEAIQELQEEGYCLPDYPDDPQNSREEEIFKRYNKVKGSAVNPVLRMGNSDRRAPKAVKNYAKKNPHSMGTWTSNSKTHVATMGGGDFHANEKALTISEDTIVRIEFIDKDGNVKVLKDNIHLLAREVIDGTLMRKKALINFLQEQVEDAREKGVLFSLHMKATMMKVSDPIIFGHAVRVYFKEVFEKYATILNDLDVDVNNGFGDLLEKIEVLPDSQKEAILADINKAYSQGPDLAMVDSDEGITNLHVPSDIIIDASMPAMIRNAGKMWNSEGQLQETKAVIPDSSYAGIYQVVIDFCKEHGAFDPATMGTVPNVGLMAQKADEYGSHDKTFEIEAEGHVRIVKESGEVLVEHDVEEGDIWRMCQAKDAPIQDWIKLAINRARATNVPAVFWMEEERPYDFELIKKIKTYLSSLDTEGLEIHIMAPEKAMKFSLERIRQGLDTISVTGNVLRDFNTDLFPILELGTSAKMLSIVPLMNGGGLFETGAGGSAPKHVDQFVEEGHLRWDSLGEFMALVCSLEHYGDVHHNQKAAIMSKELELAIEDFLENRKSPSRKVGELDNRGSHFYLALYWAERLTNQDDSSELKDFFTKIAFDLRNNETKIIDELNAAQGSPVDLGGYYAPDDHKAIMAMRPSPTLNSLIEMMTLIDA
ncbi:MAG: NADP-dependent isocitrate dehydrogenase [Saprospiraceae bacterium]|nr:NADP-dependent isocitrate dehydrogenase [Saprospiraceae bacterium]